MMPLHSIGRVLFSIFPAHFQHKPTQCFIQFHFCHGCYSCCVLPALPPLFPHSHTVFHVFPGLLGHASFSSSLNLFFAFGRCKALLVLLLSWLLHCFGAGVRFWKSGGAGMNGYNWRRGGARIIGRFCGCVGRLLWKEGVTWLWKEGIARVYLLNKFQEDVV